MTSRAEVNLLAYANLIGLLRYFHPSDQSAYLDWDRFVVETVSEVEVAGDAGELLEVFSRLSSPIAPTARFFLTGQTPPDVVVPKAVDARAVAWQHYGLQTGSPRSGFHFDSRRVGGYLPTPPGEVQRRLHPAPEEGTFVRLRLAGRLQAEQELRPEAEIWLRAFDDAGKVVTESRQALSGDSWVLYSAGLSVPAGAASLSYGLQLSGGGVALIDEVTIERVKDDGGVVHLQTDDFDDGAPGFAATGWILPPASRATGFRAEIHRAAAYRGGGSLRFALSKPRPVPDPEARATADLGGGVAVVFPVALYADREGTLPHREPAPSNALKRQAAAFEPSGEDRSTRLAAVLLLNAALTHFYPYEDGRRAFSAGVATALRSAALAPDGRSFADALRRLVSELKDGHAEMIHPSDWRRFRIPVLWTWTEEGLVVHWAARDVPRIRPGDVVLQIDGEDTLQALAEAERLAAGATPGHTRFRALELLAAGTQDQERRLLLRRGKEEPFEVQLRCNSYAFGSQSPRRESPGTLAEPEPGILYVDLERIDDHDFQAALPELASARGIIFDLRGYPARISPLLVVGHLISKPVPLSSSAVLMATRPGELHQEDSQPYGAKPLSPRLTAMAVFLADERAVSRAEAFLQIIVENQLATIVGSPTAGTQGEINEMVLPGGYRVLWTGTRALAADGSIYRGRGIQPALVIRPTQAGIAAGRDEVLERAISWLQAGGANL